MPVGTAKFHLNRCNESPLRGEKPDFWPVSKNNTGRLPLRGNPAGNKIKIFFHVHVCVCVCVCVYRVDLKLHKVSTIVYMHIDIYIHMHSD